MLLLGTQRLPAKVDTFLFFPFGSNRECWENDRQVKKLRTQFTCFSFYADDVECGICHVFVKNIYLHIHLNTVQVKFLVIAKHKQGFIKKERKENIHGTCSHQSDSRCWFAAEVRKQKQLIGCSRKQQFSLLHFFSSINQPIVPWLCTFV